MAKRAVPFLVTGLAIVLFLLFIAAVFKSVLAVLTSFLFFIGGITLLWWCIQKVAENNLDRKIKELNKK